MKIVRFNVKVVINQPVVNVTGRILYSWERNLKGWKRIVAGYIFLLQLIGNACVIKQITV